MNKPSAIGRVALLALIEISLQVGSHQAVNASSSVKLKTVWFVSFRACAGYALRTPEQRGRVMSASTDELAIRQLAARYIDAVNRRDEGDWSATWSRDASWNLMGMQVSGREAIVAMWKGAMGTFRWVVMMLGSGTIELDGDTASGRWYLT